MFNWYAFYLSNFNSLILSSSKIINLISTICFFTYEGDSFGWGVYILSFVRCRTPYRLPHDQYNWVWFVDINDGWLDNKNLADDLIDLNRGFDVYNLTIVVGTDTTPQNRLIRWCKSSLRNGWYLIVLTRRSKNASLILLWLK